METKTLKKKRGNDKGRYFSIRLKDEETKARWERYLVAQGVRRGQKNTWILEKLGFPG